MLKAAYTRISIFLKPISILALATVLPGGGGTPLCAAPKGGGFAPFWSENGYTLCLYWSGIWYGFRGNYGVYELIYRFNSK